MCSICVLGCQFICVDVFVFFFVLLTLFEASVNRVLDITKHNILLTIGGCALQLKTTT